MNQDTLKNFGRYLIGAMLAAAGFTRADIYKDPAGAVKHEGAVILENLHKIDDIQADVKFLRAAVEGMQK